MQTSGAMRRENADVYQRHCERSEAHPLRSRALHGSLRSTRILTQTRPQRTGYPRMCGI